VTSESGDSRRVWPFWNEKTRRCSEGHLPPVDLLEEPRLITDISNGCFVARVFPAAGGPTLSEKWRAILEPSFPSPPVPPVPIVKTRKRKVVPVPPMEAEKKKTKTSHRQGEAAPDLPDERAGRVASQVDGNGEMDL